MRTYRKLRTMEIVQEENAYLVVNKEDLILQA